MRPLCWNRSAVIELAAGGGVCRATDLSADGATLWIACVPPKIDGCFTARTRYWMTSNAGTSKAPPYSDVVGRTRVAGRFSCRDGP